MITTIAEFADAVAFETYLLDRMLPVLNKNENGSIDLRGGTAIAAASIHESMSAEAVAKVKDELTPLLFGAAWKILDLLLELALHKAGLRPPNKANEWRIGDKRTYAQKGDGDLTVLTKSPAVWRAVLALYAATVEHRHCLVHRTATVDANSGELAGHDRAGIPLTPLSAAEQKASARVALLAAEGVIKGGLERRNEEHLQYFLDQLTNHTKHTSFGVTKSGVPAEILLKLVVEKDGYVVDVAEAAGRASKVFAGVLHFDVMFDVPDGSGRRLRAKLEDIPKGRSVINLSSLPSWIAFV